MIINNRVVCFLGEEARQNFNKLKGKWVLRSVYSQMTSSDNLFISLMCLIENSYTSVPIYIYDVTDNHVLIKNTPDSHITILNIRYYDQYWVECPKELIQQFEDTDKCCHNE